MQNKSHLTALTRKGPSAPAILLVKKGLIKGRVLDYGCGKGKDVEWLRTVQPWDKKVHHVLGYDPHFRPGHIFLGGKFDTVLCTYVLNVVQEAEAVEIATKVWGLLKKGGSAFFAVRRDVKKDGVTSRGTFQRRVELPWVSVAKGSGFEIYELHKERK